MLKYLLIDLYNYLCIILFRYKWRKRNKNNFTYAVNIFNMDNVVVGNYTYGGLTVRNEKIGSFLRIGSFCSIANGVVFIPQSDHNLHTLSTFPFKKKCLNLDVIEATSKGDIEIGDDVWLGENAVVLSGVKISRGAVIGAGTVVTKDVPPYAIFCGNPGRVIKYRFSNDIIKNLNKIDFDSLSRDIIMKSIDTLYLNLLSKTYDQIDVIVNQLPCKDVDSTQN